MIVQDQMGRKVELKKYPPQKIVSLVPSVTELLAELGLQECIKGITKFCIHPKEVYQTCEKIGGTKNLNIKKIQRIQPDLIIGSKEENVKLQIEELAKYFPVWMSDVNSYEEALQMIYSVGEITNTSAKAQSLIQEIERAFNTLKGTDYLLKNKRVLYLIWYKPFMAAARHTYIHDILIKIGAINSLTTHTRYVEIRTEVMQKLDIDYLLLSSEPYPFKESHKTELQNLLGRRTKVLLVDGELFSWYGVRMKYLPEYLLRMAE